MFDVNISIRNDNFVFFGFILCLCCYVYWCLRVLSAVKKVVSLALFMSANKSYMHMMIFVGIIFVQANL